MDKFSEVVFFIGVVGFFLFGIVDVGDFVDYFFYFSWIWLGVGGEGFVVGYSLGWFVRWVFG